MMRRLFRAVALAVCVATSALQAAAAAPTSQAPHDASDTSAPMAGIDPRIAAGLAGVSAERLRDDDAHLVGFGTRNTFSERLGSPTRGIAAAREWIANRFREIAKSSGGRMTVAIDSYTQAATPHTPRAVNVSSVIAVLRGDDPARGLWVMSSHYDSRNTSNYDAAGDAPGADDNGSAVSAVLEAARVLTPLHLRASVAFAAFAGEEQGLWGSGHYAKALRERKALVEGDLNDDIVGASVGHDGRSRSGEVRLFSEALPADAQLRTVDLIGTDNDSPSRELARAVQEIDAAYVPAMTVRTIYRADRFLRGGDQESFTVEGYPAIRFVEAAENFDHQHQNVRDENGVQYGDLLNFMDFAYLARVTQLNAAALATLASAPATPTVTVLARKLGYDTTLTWNTVSNAASYEVLWRRTDEPAWTHAENVGNVTTTTVPLSKDDWLFGVRAVDAAGHASVAAFPTPLLR